jgi:hypothetical protein
MLIPTLPVRPPRLQRTPEGAASAAAAEHAAGSAAAEHAAGVIRKDAGRKSEPANVIKMGERSERVSRLQFAMVQLGFMWPSKIRCVCGRVRGFGGVCLDFPCIDFCYALILSFSSFS